MSKRYRVLLHVASPVLPTLISLVDDHDSIRIVQISDLADDEPLPPASLSASPPPPSPPTVAAAAPSSERYAGGKRLKGISGKELVLEILRSGPGDLDEIRRAFVNRGFAAASAAPTLSNMLRDGLIRRASHGRYVLNPTPLQTTGGT